MYEPAKQTSRVFFFRFLRDCRSQRSRHLCSSVLGRVKGSWRGPGKGTGPNRGAGRGELLGTGSGSGGRKSSRGAGGELGRGAGRGGELELGRGAGRGARRGAGKGTGGAWRGAGTGGDGRWTPVTVISGMGSAPSSGSGRVSGVELGELVGGGKPPVGGPISPNGGSGRISDGKKIPPMSPPTRPSTRTMGGTSRTGRGRGRRSGSGGFGVGRRGCRRGGGSGRFSRRRRRRLVGDRPGAGDATDETNGRRIFGTSKNPRGGGSAGSTSRETIARAASAAALKSKKLRSRSTSPKDGGNGLSSPVSVACESAASIAAPRAWS